MSENTTCIAFSGHTCIAAGDLVQVAAAAKTHIDTTGPDGEPVLVFDAETSRPVEIDFRGSVADVVERLAPPAPVARVRRGPGRPKLGVVGHEVTLLPRHWDWLYAQPGGASVTIRKLVEAARGAGAGEEAMRDARDATYRFMLALAGNEPGFEEAMRALYSDDAAGFERHTESWPTDVREHARRLAARGFSAGSE